MGSPRSTIGLVFIARPRGPYIFWACPTSRVPRKPRRGGLRRRGQRSSTPPQRRARPALRHGSGRSRAHHSVGPHSRCLGDRPCAGRGPFGGVIGLTIVASAPSMPELVPSIVARGKGEGDVAFGNIIGSNIFNNPRDSRRDCPRQPPCLVPESVIGLRPLGHGSGHDCARRLRRHRAERVGRREGAALLLAICRLSDCPLRPCLSHREFCGFRGIAPAARLMKTSGPDMRFSSPRSGPPATLTQLVPGKRGLCGPRHDVRIAGIAEMPSASGAAGFVHTVIAGRPKPNAPKSTPWPPPCPARRSGSGT